MATEQSYDGNNSNTKFNITFPFLKDTHIGVSVGGITQTVTTHYSISGTEVTFVTAPPVGTENVKIYRNTPITAAEHDYSAGSAIRASSLNDNQKQALYAIEEAKLVTVTSGGITTGSKNDVTVNSDTDWVINDNAIEKVMMADNSVGPDEIEQNAVGVDELANNAVDTNAIIDLNVTTAKIANDAITGAKIDDDAVDSEHIAADAVDSEHIAAGAVDLEHMSSQSVDEDNLHISNAGSNGEFLQKQSGNTGGLTWASPITKFAGFATAKYTGSSWTPTSGNTYEDAPSLTITYTPVSTSSTIALTAYLNLQFKAQQQTSTTNYGEAKVKFVVTPSGGSAADVGEEQKLNPGSGSDHSANVSLAAQLEQKYVFYDEYANSNTTQKVFKIQLNRVDGTLNLNANEGHSYITLTEILN